jgi:hypothetical protein
MSAREQRCVWIAPSEEPDDRYLVPGCWERVLDWDAECTCKSTAQEVDEAEAEIARLKDEMERVSNNYHALISTVSKHQDGQTLLEQADRMAAQWGAQRQLVKAQERPR